MLQEGKNLVTKVQIKPIAQDENGELSDKVLRKCCFCEKKCTVFPVNKQLLTKLSGPDAFYCDFCLRHNFNSKNNRNIMILTFRSIIGYFYYQNYLLIDRGNAPNVRRTWVSEIEDYIEYHREAGECNPIFVYDPETLLWFVDFSKVGDTRRKVPLDEVLKTVMNILLCFNLYETVPGVNINQFFQKYKDAITNFYEKRHRPEKRRILSPTFMHCGIYESKTVTFAKMREFVLDDVKIRK